MFDTIALRAASMRHDDAPILRLGRAEAFCAASFVSALPEQTRYRRFHRAMSPIMLRAHYDALDWNTAIVLAWIERGEILGIAEVHPYPVRACREAEIALSLKPFAIKTDRKKSPHPSASEPHHPTECVEPAHDALDPCAGHFGLALMASALSRAVAAGARRSHMLLCPPDPVQYGIARILGARFDALHDTFVFSH
jgi:hypothetical protein